jgi:ribosomal protein S12
VLFREEGYSSLFLNASRVKLISGFETPMQVTTSCGHDHNSLNPFSSVVVTEGREQLIPFVSTHFSRASNQEEVVISELVRLRAKPWPSSNHA